MDVLLVEDDSTVRACLADVLGDAGLQVAEASNAAEALSRPQASTAPLVLVTDLNLNSGLDGLELAEIACRRWPSIGVVLISGDDVASSCEGASYRFLQKPFRGDSLVQAVHDLIPAG
jgi:two-component system, response regulator PdtaR